MISSALFKSSLSARTYAVTHAAKSDRVLSLRLAGGMMDISNHIKTIHHYNSMKYYSTTTSHNKITKWNDVSDPLCIRTKVVCTIGPSTDTIERIDELLENGMNVARLNFSHAGDDYSYPEQCFHRIRNAKGQHAKIAKISISERKSANNLRAILVDTKGPEIRTGPLPQGEEKIEIHTGQVVEIHTDQSIVDQSPIPTNETDVLRLRVDYMSIATTVRIGSHILLDDGLIALEVTDIDYNNYQYVITKALNGGPIKKNKGVNLPGLQLDLPALTEKDKRDLLWACHIGADFIAASFIRTAENVRNVIAYLERCISEVRIQHQRDGLSEQRDYRPPLRPLVISKIESQEGVENFDAILEESDGIMVARGDLGVEILYSKVFAEQKRMVTACNRAGKPVIVATQMLDSMIRNPRPTRAEVTDVGTAVFDGTDAVMLSGETAAGKYPIESLYAMRSILVEADHIVDNLPYRKRDTDYSAMRLKSNDRSIRATNDDELDAVAASAARSAKEMNAKLIILISMSGRVARAVARHGPTVPVLAFCTDPQVARRLQLHRCVIPLMLQSSLDPGSATTRMGLLRAEAVRTAKELGFLKNGDRIIMVDRTVGKADDLHHFAHNMKVVTVADQS